MIYAEGNFPRGFVVDMASIEKIMQKSGACSPTAYALRRVATTPPILKGQSGGCGRNRSKAASATDDERASTQAEPKQSAPHQREPRLHPTCIKAP